MTDHWISTNEAAARLGITRQAVHRRVNSGKIAAKRVPGPRGRGVRVLVSLPEETFTIPGWLWAAMIVGLFLTVAISCMLWVKS